MLTKLTIASLTLGLTAIGGPVVVDISATQFGCSQCNSPQSILPGTVVNIYSPKDQITLGPGTYTITNADPNGTDQFSAWNFNMNQNPAWVWSFVVANDATSTVLLDDYIGGTTASPNGIYPTQALAASATGIKTFDGNTQLSGTSTAGFTDSLVLSSTTTLDFFIDDYALGDNLGGVALAITCTAGGCLGNTSGVPEPATFGMMIAGLAGVFIALRKRQ